MLSVPHPAGLLLSLPAWLQVFYLDSLKFFLSLYGHKLPVLCMDISSDSTLLVSGSADKNIKVNGVEGLWLGLDKAEVGQGGRRPATGVGQGRVGTEVSRSRRARPAAQRPARSGD